MNELVEQLVTQFRAAWKYRWYAAAAAWIIAIAGWSAVYMLPNRYEANARVFVDTQSMLRPLLSGLAVQPNIDQTVSMMSRTLVSSVNVGKIIDTAGFSPGVGDTEDRERLIERLTREITIKSGGRENLYTISYTDRDRQRAKRVVQTLLTIFMEGSVGDKRKDSTSAREFIEEQLKSYSDKLIAAENAVTEFKRRNQGLMPGEGRDFYGALSEAKSTLLQASLGLKEAINARDAIKHQLAGEMPAAPAVTPGAPVIARPSEIDLRIRALEQKLDSLRLNYTDAHPDIVAVQRIIEQLKEQKAAEEREQERAEAAGTPTHRTLQGPLYDQLMVSLAAAEAHVAAMKARVAEYQGRYDELRAAANKLPQVEAEYKQLTRDYEVIKARYDKLLERRESAQISGDVEASDVAMGFRIIDPPQVPLAPSAPNRPRLVAMVLAAALGGGFGLALVLSQMRTTFNDERKLRETSGLRVLGSVAIAWTDKQKKRRARGILALLFSFLSLLSTFAAIMVSLLLSAARV